MSTPATIRLRPASYDDARFLFDLRNDPQSRQASLSQDEVSFKAHCQWLKASLVNPARRIFIAERDGVAVASGRIDHGEDGLSLSWTVAPQARGGGIGRQLVAALAGMEFGPLTAVIRSENTASRRIAEANGFILRDDTDGVCRYVRPGGTL